MSIKSLEELEVATGLGKNSAPIQFPSDLKNENFTGNRYVIHFKIIPHKEGRFKSKDQKISNPSPSEPNRISNDASGDMITKNKDNKSRKDIYLYMPENITETYAHDWENVELGSLARIIDLADMSLSGRGSDAWSQLKEQLKRMGTGAIEGVTALNATQIRERNTGIILNPNIEMLYKGTQIKQHSFQFKFIPKNKQEATAAKQIVEMFKYYSAPSFPSNAGTGVVLEYPDIFEIEFLYGGKEANLTNDDSWMYHIAPCALSNVEVNYTGAGQFASHHDGSVVQIDLSLQFTELTIQTKQRIKSNNTKPEILGVLN